MDVNKVLTRDNTPVDEMKEEVTKTYKGLELSYVEIFYLDYEVNEDTGAINKEKKEKHYTKRQMERNLKALKSAYMIAKGAAAPDEIISFRHKYHIAASTLSLILGFSKNTISNIENEGVTSLPTGRLIKMCLNNREMLSYYIKVCDTIDHRRKEELSSEILHYGA